MEYTEITLKVPCVGLETAEAVAQMVSPHGFYVEDYSDMLTVAPQVGRVDYYDDALLASDTDNALIHIYLAPDMHPQEAAAFVSERLSAEGINCELTQSTVEDSDWAERWKAYYKPFRASERITVCPSWLECECESGQTVLKIDPGMAFGSGTHETTKLCIQALDRLVLGGERVLDLGCGSGILGIAAAKLGAGEVSAADVENTAVECARENAKLNSVQLNVVYGDPCKCGTAHEQLGSGYDIIVSNIVADVILAYRGYYRAVLKNGGTLVVSGIISSRSAEVERGLLEAGFTISDRRELSEWVCLVLK